MWIYCHYTSLRHYLHEDLVLAWLGNYFSHSSAERRHQDTSSAVLSLGSPLNRTGIFTLRHPSSCHEFMWADVCRCSSPRPIYRYSLTQTRFNHEYSFLFVLHSWGNWLDALSIHVYLSVSSYILLGPCTYTCISKQTPWLGWSYIQIDLCVWEEWMYSHRPWSDCACDLGAIPTRSVAWLHHGCMETKSAKIMIYIYVYIYILFASRMHWIWRISLSHIECSWEVYVPFMGG